MKTVFFLLCALVVVHCESMSGQAVDKDKEDQDEKEDKSNDVDVDSDEFDDDDDMDDDDDDDDDNTDDDDDDNDDNDNDDNDDSIDIDTDTDPIIDMDCSECPAVGPSLDNMLCAFDICDKSVVKSHSFTDGFVYLPFCNNGEDTFEAVERFGDTSNELEPKLNDSYALMATGIAVGDTDHTKFCYNQPVGSDPFSNETAKMFDVVEWTMELTAPPEALGFEFKFVFFSAEYEEYIGKEFNDKFYVILEAQSTAGGKPTIINYTKCRKPDAYYDFECTAQQADEFGCEEGEKYCYIAINSAFSECCWYEGCPDSNPLDNTDISGTGFECPPDDVNDSNRYGSSTGWLKTTWSIKGNETFKLTFHLHDTADYILDSQVILDAFRFRKEEGDDDTVIIE